MSGSGGWPGSCRKLRFRVWLVGSERAPAGDEVATQLGAAARMTSVADARARRAVRITVGVRPIMLLLCVTTVLAEEWRRRMRQTRRARRRWSGRRRAGGIPWH